MMRRLCSFLVLVVLSSSLFVSRANADLIIILNGNDAGEPGTVAGGGSLSSVMRAAADYWEGVFAPDTSIAGFTLTINYGWGNLSGTVLGSHSLVSQNNFPPHRETEANLTFDNTNPVNWFLDPTPFDHSEYNTFTEVNGDFGGGSLIAERFFTDATGDAVGRWDMFSVALHEIGHGLGLSSANTAFLNETRAQGEDDDTIEIENPLPFSGSVLPVEANNAHLSSGSFSQALMTTSIGNSLRKLPSHADILANAQVSQFNAVNLDIIAIPEPATGSVVFFAALMLAGFRRRHAR